MLAVYAVLLLAFSAVLFVWAYGQFRRVNPKKWTTWESASQGVVITIVGLFAVGVGLLLRVLGELGSSPVTLTHWIMMAAVVVAGIVLGRVLHRRAVPHLAAQPTMAGPSLDGDAPVAAAANDPGPGTGPRPVRGTGRRAA